MVVLLVSISTAAFAQKGGPRSGYNFTTVVDLKTTPVKDQQSVGTCWDYAALSFLESELLRKGKPVYDLAELYVAKNAYFEKGLRYVQFHGKTNFSEGGQAHDVIDMIKKYGIVPEEVYTGLQYGRDFHIHAEMVAALQGILDAINENPNRRITPVWTKGFMRYIEAYLGDTPKTFTYEGKEYTPQSFAESLDLNLDDYVELTSYQIYPFYEEVELTIPDNWMHARYYFFMAWFAAAVLVAVMVDHMSEGQPVFAGLILTAVALFAVLNLKYTYYEAATTQDNLKEYQEVADYLTEAGIDYGYAEFWDAERICLITDGRVTMGHSYTMASLSGYWWLTSTKWYPPTLPTEMRTAYVVRTEMREAFEQQFPEGEAPILEYENEKLAVYVGDRNYVEL